MKTILSTLIILLTLYGRAFDSRIIDFETMPDGSIPTEGLSVSNQFNTTHGVSFIFENGTYPQIGEIGWPTNRINQFRPFAFWGPPGSSNPDGPATNQNVGRFFLSDGRAANGLGVSGIPPALLVFFAEPSGDVSGEIVDIQSEGWLIEARGQQTQIVAQVLVQGTNCPNCGDGRSSPFSISTNGIWSLRISSMQTSGSVGWAFDNFCPNLPYAPARLYAVKAQQNLELAIGGTFNKSYLVEYNTNLLSDTWQPLVAVSLTNSPTHWVIDTNLSNSTSRYYRAVALP
jgi:hypothetical protein